MYLFSWFERVRLFSLIFHRPNNRDRLTETEATGALL